MKAICLLEIEYVKSFKNVCVLGILPLQSIDKFVWNENERFEYFYIITSNAIITIFPPWIEFSTNSEP